MDPTYVFRRYEKSDIREMAIVVNQVFGINKSSDYWEWLYFRNPAGQALCTVVLFDGRLVGLMNDIPVRYSVGGTDFLAVQGVDLAIIEDYRRLDVFMKLDKTHSDILSDANVDVALGIANEYSSKVALQSPKHKKICPIPRLVKVLNAKPFLGKTFSRKALAKILSPIVNTVLGLRYSPKVAIPEGMQIKQTTRFDDRFDTFWNRIKDDYPIMTVRDQSYLNWRYVDPKHMDFEIVCLERTGSSEIIAFMVLGEVNEDELFRGKIFEIMTPRTEEPLITRCLLGFAISHFRLKKTDVIDCWMLSHCHMHPQLTKIGFIPREKETMNLLFLDKNLKNSAVPQDVLKNSTNWFLSIGDLYI